MPLSDGSFRPVTYEFNSQRLPLTCDSWSVRGSTLERWKSHAFGMGMEYDTSPQNGCCTAIVARTLFFKKFPHIGKITHRRTPRSFPPAENLPFTLHALSASSGRSALVRLPTMSADGVAREWEASEPLPLSRLHRSPAGGYFSPVEFKSKGVDEIVTARTSKLHSAQ